ncbi:MAG: hypothetical protein ACXADO_10075 [Candidatus Thorarchaeota archaeon]|jgi:hypothetical protein
MTIASVKNDRYKKKNSMSWEDLTMFYLDDAKIYDEEEEEWKRIDSITPIELAEGIGCSPTRAGYLLRSLGWVREAVKTRTKRGDYYNTTRYHRPGTREPICL